MDRRLQKQEERRKTPAGNHREKRHRQAPAFYGGEGREGIQNVAGEDHELRLWSEP